MLQEEVFDCDCPVDAIEPSMAGVGGAQVADSQSPVSVQGRLRSHAAFWLKDLNASSFVAGIHFATKPAISGESQFGIEKCTLCFICSEGVG